jgi:predicted outer membrane repeat protein
MPKLLYKITQLVLLLSLSSLLTGCDQEIQNRLPLWKEKLSALTKRPSSPASPVTNPTNTIKPIAPLPVPQNTIVCSSEIKVCPGTQIPMPRDKSTCQWLESQCKAVTTPEPIKKPVAIPIIPEPTNPNPPAPISPPTPPNTASGPSVVTKCTDDTDLKRAVEQSPAGTTITFNCGKSIIPISSSIFIRKPLTINGQNNITLDGKGSQRIFVVSKQEEWLVDGRLNPTAEQGGAGIEFKLNNIVLTNGFGNNLKGGSDNITNGGAVFIGGWGHFTAENVSFLKNISKTDGGAISMLSVSGQRTGTKVKLTNCIFENNLAGGSGGAISMSGGSDSLEIIGGSFKTNKASCSTSDCQNSEGGGGAIRSMGAKITMTGNTNFENNESIFYGGAISIIQSEMQISDTIFKGNIANGSKEDRGGGAIYFDGLGGHNKADIQSSGKNFSASNWRNITFSQNKAPNRGGAVYGALYGGDTLSIDNNTFSDNSVKQNRGSAICIDSSDGCSGNCSVTFNSSKFPGASTSGSALAVLDAVKTSPTIYLRDTIIPGW